MKLQIHNKIVAWVMCVSLLNLMLVVAPFSMTMVQARTTSQALSSQEQNTFIMPCHDAAASHDEFICDQHGDTKCKFNCTSCVLVYFGIPFLTHDFTSKTGTYTSTISLAASSSVYRPIPPPPKYLS